MWFAFSQSKTPLLPNAVSYFWQGFKVVLPQAVCGFLLAALLPERLLNRLWDGPWDGRSQETADESLRHFVLRSSR